MLEQLISADRRLRIEYLNVRKACNEAELHMLEIISQYLTDYCNFYKLDAPSTHKKYINFINRYVDDFKVFIHSGKYPFESGNPEAFERISYDLALILSVFFTPVRCAIFSETMRSLKVCKGTILIIGVGAAIELELIRKLFPERQVHAYDLSISSFVKSRFPVSMLHEEEFIFNQGKTFDNILAIELLEHLAEPYVFLRGCANCLKANGNLLCTTASNMPQFDHLYNFFHHPLEHNITGLQLKVSHQSNLKHRLINPEIDSFNTYYHLIKV